MAGASQARYWSSAGDDVAVEQHRALGHAGGAAGVLQEGDVLVARASTCFSGLPLPSAEHVA